MKVKEQTKKKHINDTKINNIPKIKFKVMVKIMSTKVKTRMNEHSKIFNKEIATTNKFQP